VGVHARQSASDAQSLHKVNLSFWSASVAGRLVLHEQVLCRDCGRLHQRSQLTWAAAFPLILLAWLPKLGFSVLREGAIALVALLAAVLGGIALRSFCSGFSVGLAAFAVLCALDALFLRLVVRGMHRSTNEPFREASACPTCGSQRKQPAKALKVGPLDLPCPNCREAHALVVISRVEHSDEER
jgi:ssDNA-binding Zn-finger/Zn-ribbon topoisomerase 1